MSDPDTATTAAALGPDHICGRDTCGADFAVDAAAAAIARWNLFQGAAPEQGFALATDVLAAARPVIEAEACAAERQRLADRIFACQVAVNLPLEDVQTGAVLISDLRAILLDGDDDA